MIDPKTLLTLGALAIATIDAVAGCWFILRSRHYRENGIKREARVVAIHPAEGRFYSADLEFTDESGTVQRKQVNIGRHNELSLSDIADVYVLPNGKTATEGNLRTFNVTGGVLLFASLAIAAAAFIVPSMIMPPV